LNAGSNVSQKVLIHNELNKMLRGNRVWKGKQKKMLGEKNKSYPQDPSTSYGKND